MGYNTDLIVCFVESICIGPAPARHTRIKVCINPYNQNPSHPYGYDTLHGNLAISRTHSGRGIFPLFVVHSITPPMGACLFHTPLRVESRLIPQSLSTFVQQGQPMTPALFHILLFPPLSNALITYPLVRLVFGKPICLILTAFSRNV